MMRQFHPVMIATSLVALAAISACRHSMDPPSPARLADTEPETMDALRKALARAMGEAQVVLGASHPDKTGAVVVLPRRLSSVEDRSLAQPVRFDLELHGETCFAVRHDTGERVRLAGIDCKALE